MSIKCINATTNTVLGVANPAQVLGVVAGDPYWPVAGVTKPQHMWPFALTGDYTDRGSTGGLNLTAAGTGNSFGANGLVLNGSGYASVGVNADISDLGSVYSILVEFSVPAVTGFPCLVCAGVRSTNGWDLFATWGSGNPHFERGLTGDFGFTGTPVSINNPVQIIIVSEGTGINEIHFYADGSPDVNTTLLALTAGTGSFFVGTDSSLTYKLTGTIKRAAILKGTAWSASDVAAIYAAL
jgi:hypothetical protein